MVAPSRRDSGQPGFGSATCLGGVVSGTSRRWRREWGDIVVSRPMRGREGRRGRRERAGPRFPTACGELPRPRSWERLVAPDQRLATRDSRVSRRPSSSLLLLLSYSLLAHLTSLVLAVCSQFIMSDDEHHDVHFESTDSGASKTFPMQAGNIRKNGYIVIKGRPCKVVDVSTSKTGKHGHAKCNFTALDIFTNKKLEDLQPSSHNCDVPNVTRTEFTLIDISDDGFVSLMTESGDTKDDLSLPKGTDDLEKLAAQIQADFDEGKEVVVSVLAVRDARRVVLPVLVSSLSVGRSS